MGVHAMVKAELSRFKTSNTTNPRYFAKILRRFSGIAQKLDASGDAAQRSEFVETVQATAKQLVQVIGSSESDISSQLAPRIYLEEQKILSGADRMLDEFQPPPKGHAKLLEDAMSKDKKAMGMLLAELSEADDGILKSACELGPSSVEPLPRPQSLQDTAQPRQQSALHMIQEYVIERVGTSSSTGAMSQASTLQSEERAYAQFEKRLEAYRNGKREPSIMIAISTMGSDSMEAVPQLIPAHQTFCDLADTFVDYNSQNFVPDFWSKEIDPAHNQVTPSALWFAWQDPNKKVIDVINKEGHLGIETVYKNAEYVVALVKLGERENGVPVDIPRANRPSAFEYFAQLFPNYTVTQVCRLEGSDASMEVFDYRFFTHKTNALFVELKTGPMTRDVVDMVSTEVASKKGKGKARFE